MLEQEIIVSKTVAGRETTTRLAGVQSYWDRFIILYNILDSELLYTGCFQIKGVRSSYNLHLSGLLGVLLRTLIGNVHTQKNWILISNC